MTTTTDDTIALGTFIQGEIPDPLEYSFKTYSGGPLPLPTPPFTAVFQWWEQLTGVPQQRPATISDPPNGAVTYVWNGSEFQAPGHYRGHIWAGNAGGARYASVPITWTVACAPPPTPTV
jgi:hypothetical protein